MITFKGALYSYGDFKLGMDFAIESGALVAVLGPSGAGKSTLLNIIAGFESLDHGSLLLNGQDVQNLPPASRPVSMVFQDNNTFAHLSARDNIALGVRPNLRLDEREWAQVDAALERVELANLSSRKPGDMSGGERQRIAIARALVRDKPILLLDEAFAALGPKLRGAMLDLVAELHREKLLTTLMVTHNPADARRVSDQVIFVGDGVVRAPVATDAFFGLKDDREITVYLGDTD
jgi:thiamine transport system ATP-binding protein